VSKSNDFETALLQLIFQNANIANIGDATGLRGSTAAGSLYYALHTADPGEVGTAVTSETAYTGYARVGLARTAGNFPISGGNTVSPGANVDFGECTASPGGAITHFSITNTASGAGMILYKGAMTPNITMAAGVIPRIKAAGTTITED
jgi:hypothetical protein